MDFQYKHIFIRSRVASPPDLVDSAHFEKIRLDTSSLSDGKKSGGIYLPHRAKLNVPLPFQMALTVELAGAMVYDRKLFAFDFIPSELTAHIEVIYSYAFFPEANGSAMKACRIFDWSDYLEICAKYNSTLDLAWVRANSNEQKLCV